MCTNHTLGPDVSGLAHPQVRQKKAPSFSAGAGMSTATFAGLQDDVSAPLSISALFNSFVREREQRLILKFETQGHLYLPWRGKNGFSIPKR